MDINEDSLDLYTDLITEDYSNQPSKTDSTESQEQITEVLSNAKATIQSLEIELQEKAKKEAELQKRIEILEKNNSSLLLTAKSELGRKNSVISDLRDQIDEHTKSRFYNGKFNKFPDKNQSFSSRKRENNVSPMKNRKRKNEEIDEKKDSKRCRASQRSGGSETRNNGETESKTNKLIGNRSPKSKSCDGTSDNMKTCDRTKNVETFDLRDKLRRRKPSGKDIPVCQRQKIDSKSPSKPNKIVITNGADDAKSCESKAKSCESQAKSCESQCESGISKADSGETKLPIPVDNDGHAKLSDTGIKKSTSMKQNTKCIMDVVNKLSNKANDNKSNFVIPKLSKRRSSLEEDSTLDNRVLDCSISAESSDETEKLIVDLNSASDLKRPSCNSLNTEVINAKCNVSQSETKNDLNGNIERVPKTFQIEKKQTTSGSDSDFTSKLQVCVDMLSDSDTDETELWNTNRTLETSTGTNKVLKVKNMEPNNLKHDAIQNAKNSSSVKDMNETEKELMSPPKSLPKKKKCENKNVSGTVSQISANKNPDVSEKVASDSSSNILTNNSPNLLQTMSVVNRILDLSKSVALNAQTQNVTHKPLENNYKESKHIQRPPIENNYEEPKHIQRHPVENNYEESKHIQRPPVENNYEELKHIQRHPVENNYEEPKHIQRPPVENNYEEPKHIQRHPVENNYEEPKHIQRHPVENNYEEPKHNTISYFTWKIPHQLTFSDTNPESCKYREQNRVFGIQNVPLSDPRTKITGDKISYTNIVTNTPKPSSDLLPNLIQRACLLNEQDKKGNVGEKQHKDHEKKTSSRSKDGEKRSTTERKDNDGVKVSNSPVKDKTASKTSKSEKASEDSNKQPKTSKNEDRELPGTSDDVNKTSKKRSKKSSSSKSNHVEEIVEKPSNSSKPLTQKSKGALEKAARHAAENHFNKKREQSNRKSDASPKKFTGIASNADIHTLAQKSKGALEKAAIDNTMRRVADNHIDKKREQSNRKSDASPKKFTEIASNARTHTLENTSETDIPPTPKSHLPLIDTPIIQSIELASPKSVTKPSGSSEISTQFHSIEDIEIKAEPNFEPTASISSGLNAFSGMFMANHGGSKNETEFLKRLNKIEEEIQMLKSAAMQSLQTKVIFKFEKGFTSQDSESQQMLGTGTDDNPIIIPSSSDVATDISQAVVNSSESVSESGNLVGNQSGIRCDKSPSFHKSSENVSKDVDSPLSSLSPVKSSKPGVSKSHPVQGVADSSSGLGASQTLNSEVLTKAPMNTMEDSNSSNSSSFSVHSENSSVSSSFKAVRNSFTIHETLVTCTNSDTEDSMSESSEDENDMEIEADDHCGKGIDLNQNAAAVLKTDLDMSSDSEDGSKDHSNLLPQTVETPNDVDKNMKTPMKPDIGSPWNRISPVPKFVSPENVNCDSKLLALVNLATLDLHLSGHDVPFENKALSSKKDNNSTVSPEVLSSTPCYRKTRSNGKSFKVGLPELKNNEVNDSNIVNVDNPPKNSDSSSFLPTPIISPSLGKRQTSKASIADSPVEIFPVMCSDNPTSSEVEIPVDIFPVACSDNPKSPEVESPDDIFPVMCSDKPTSPEMEKSIVADGLKTRLVESPAEIQIPQDVKKSPNIEDFKIFQSVENDTVDDTAEPITEKEDGEITQDSIIVNDNHKQLSINPDSVYFVIDTKVDENDELFLCSNSVSEKPDKKLVTPKKKQLSSVKTRSSPRIRDKTLRDRLGVRDRTERRASDVSSRKRSRRSPSPNSLRSNGRRRLYDNNNVKSDDKSDSKPLRKPLTDSRDRDRDNERQRHKDEPTRRSSRDRSDRYRSRNCRSRS